MRHRLTLAVVLSVVLGQWVKGATAERFFYLNDGAVFQGCVYKPPGDGPFPAVVFNQSAVKPLPSDGKLDPFPELGEFYTTRGYVLFCPGRHNIPNGATKDDSSGASADVIRAHRAHADLIFAAVVAIKAQAYVKPDQIFVTGFASGATAALFLAEKDVDVRGYVLFSPAAEAWKHSAPLREGMKKALANAKAPIFLMQPQNDLGLGPSEVLGKQLTDKGPPNRTKVFPPFGENSRDANSFGFRAPNIWGTDVLSFFAKASE